MAGKQFTPSQPDEQRSLALAESLFVANWKLNGVVRDDHLAAKCLEAAETFRQVQKQGIAPKSEAA